MSTLTQKTCEACRVGAPLATDDETQQFMRRLPRWVIVEKGGIKRLQRVFSFDNFIEAMVFTQQVAALAEAENHHPALLTEWGKVTVSLVDT